VIPNSTGTDAWAAYNQAMADALYNHLTGRPDDETAALVAKEEGR